MKDVRQSKQFAAYLSNIKWTILTIDGVFVYVKPLFGIGFVKIQRPPKNISFEKTKKALKKWKVSFVTIEPTDENQANSFKADGFKESNSFSLPTKTLCIDLRRGEKKLLTEMHSKTRYNIKQAVKRGVIVSKTTDIGSFSRNWQIHARERGFFLSQTKIIQTIYGSFGNKAHIFQAKQDDDVIAELLVLIHDKTAYYYYAYTTDKGKKLFAPTLLTWNALRFAKKKGCKVFDFDGIYDSRFPLERWKGFTRFKKGFGGKEKSYPAPLVKRFVNL